MMKRSIFLITQVVSLCLGSLLQANAAPPSSQGAAGMVNSPGFFNKPAQGAPQDKKNPQGRPRLVKPSLPAMPKPIGFPGVVGLEKNKWGWADYLKYVSENIAVSVDIIKTGTIPSIPTEDALKQRISEIFRKNDLIPESGLAEGPPLPFFHMIVMVYAIDKDKFVLFGNCRLFEEIKVVRKHFQQTSYWQGITWENQNMVYATEAELNAKIDDLVDELAKNFVKRYRFYNESASDSEPEKMSGLTSS